MVNPVGTKTVKFTAWFPRPQDERGSRLAQCLHGSKVQTKEGALSSARDERVCISAGTIPRKMASSHPIG